MRNLCFAGLLSAGLLWGAPVSAAEADAAAVPVPVALFSQMSALSPYDC